MTRFKSRVGACRCFVSTSCRNRRIKPNLCTGVSCRCRSNVATWTGRRTPHQRRLPQTSGGARLCSAQSPVDAFCLRHSRCPQRVRSCSTRSVWTTTRWSSLSTSSEATIDTAETRDQLFEYFVDKVFIGREQIVIASYFHDSAAPIEFEELEEALRSGDRAGEVRTYARKREFNTSPSGGAKGIRTPDLLIANETRYQLRHSPKCLFSIAPNG